MSGGRYADSEVELIYALRAEGLTAAEIGARLGGRSSDAISKKLAQMGLTRKVGPQKKWTAAEVARLAALRAEPGMRRAYSVLARHFPGRNVSSVRHKCRRIARGGDSRPRPAAWTPEEDAALLAAHRQGTPRSEIMVGWSGRSPWSVSNRLRRLGVRNRPQWRPWSRGEVRRLRQYMTDGCSIHEIAARLGRTPQAVDAKRRRERERRRAARRRSPVFEVRLS